MDDQQRARELLAMCLDEWGCPTEASNVRAGKDLESYEGDFRLLNQLRVWGLMQYPQEPAALRAAPEVLHIRVRNNGEYGSFYLREGVEGEGDRRHHWCELTCNTAFGVVGHYWSNMGGPAAWFLAKIGRDYVIDKLWGLQSQVFDSDKAMADVRRMIVKDRRNGELDLEQARGRWDSIDMGADNEFEFHSLVNDTDWLREIAYEGGLDRIGQVDNPQAVGFFRDLWPAFLAELLAARSSVIGGLDRLDDGATVSVPANDSKVVPLAALRTDEALTEVIHHGFNHGRNELGLAVEAKVHGSTVHPVVGANLNTCSPQDASDAEVSHG